MTAEPSVHLSADPAVREPAAAREPATARTDRLGLAVTVLIALIGVMGAVVAWRLGDVSTGAGDATREAILARERVGAAEVSAGIGTLEGFAAWLDYGTARLRAAGLAETGDATGSYAASGEAAGHWMSVPAGFLDAGGGYDAAAHEAALAAEAVKDLPAVDDRVAAAAAAQASAGRLATAGLVLAAALPFLTAAEVLRRPRARRALAAAGAATVVTGIVLVAGAWA